MGRSADLGIAVIAAMAANGVIGRDGGLPWHFPEDLRHFKETTMGHPVIMGRHTFEGILDRLGEPLPGRTSIVLTSTGLGEASQRDGVIEASSLEAALEAARAVDSSTVFVIGGASVYEQVLPLADRLILTEIHAAYEGDTEFPPVDWDEWTERERDAREAFDFVEYVRTG